jgi:hypothetical protein
MLNIKIKIIFMELGGCWITPFPCGYIFEMRIQAKLHPNITLKINMHITNLKRKEEVKLDYLLST